MIFSVNGEIYYKFCLKSFPNNEIKWLPIWLPIHSRGFAELLSMRVVGICCSAFEFPMSQ